MLKRTSMILLSTLVVAMLMLFAATQAAADGSLGDGICDPSEAAKFQCFEDAGYVVEVVPCNGHFPCSDSGNNSVFSYKITRHGGSSIWLVDVLIGACKPNPLAIQQSYPWGMLFTDGKGGPITNFGRGLTLDDTWWWNYRGYGGNISLTVQGQVGAVHKAMLFSTLSFRDRFGYGEILAPGCEPERPLGVLSTGECIKFVEMANEAGEIERISASVDRDNNGCIIENSVKFYKTVDCTGDPIVPVFNNPEAGFVYKSGTGGGCPELAEVSQDSPACVTLTLQSGRETKICW